MKKLIHICTVTLAALSAALLGLTAGVAAGMPDTFRATAAHAISLTHPLPVTAALPAGASARVGAVYPVELKAFGVIPVKQASVQMVAKTYVVPCGTPFGIKIFTDGVMVVGLTDVDTADGAVNPARNAGVKEGDVILEIGGKVVNTNESIAAAVEASGGNPLDFSVRRGTQVFTVPVTPVISQTDHAYKTGIWVRDSSAGIGMLTFYDPESQTFAGLGHAVCDVDTGEQLPLMTGEICSAQITGITKGVAGSPGEVHGQFASDMLGTLLLNSETGVYGHLTVVPLSVPKIEVAARQDVREGSAQILTSLDGEAPKLFDCDIEKANVSDSSSTQNLVVHITDEQLLSKTGGIVQGMSGSPILQNGKLAGAVTHVFVRDPTRGYGIFAENMVLTSKALENGQMRFAS